MSTVPTAAELLFAVLPVTALHISETSEYEILLAGVGCHLRVIDAKTRTLLRFAKALERHAVHGIVPLGSIHTKSENEVDRIRLDVAVFGGRQLAWVVLEFTVHGRVLKCSSFKVIDTFLAKDWILACKRSSNSDLSAIFITSYNTLYRIEASTLTGRIESEVLSDGFGIFLYSADLTQTDEKSYLIASGTVFGQVLVWVCVYDEAHQIWSVSPGIQLNGHRGSIFGVDISQPYSLEGKEFRNVVSCSDDRMICVWSLPGFRINSSSSGMTSVNDFQQSDQMLVKTYGHLSRIWNASCPYFQASDVQDPLIISAGEDGQVQSWSLSQGDTAKSCTLSLEKRYVDRHHAGKNIWAQCYSNQSGKLIFVSGGADGLIVSRRYERSGRADIDSRHFSQHFKALEAILSPHILPKKKTLALKVYIATSSSHPLATTDAGHLLKCTTTNDREDWEVIALDPKLSPLVPSLTIIAEHAFFIRTSDHKLCAVEYHNARLKEICSVRQARIANIWTISCSLLCTIQSFQVCAAVSYHGSDDFELYWIEVKQEKAEVLGKSSIHLPVTFEVTSLFYDDHRQILLCGSRAGALAVSKNVSSATVDAEFQICKRRVHGQDTVTSIYKLECEPDEKISFYLTTGRDGTYCIHKLAFSEAYEPLLTVVHQVEPPIGPSIEGVHVMTRPDRTRSLLLFGFHSKNFVVWDEISQKQVMNVDCGGAHRSWMFSPDFLTGQGGTFVWTKASTFMFYQQKSLDHEIIQTGGHGREIKALAAHQAGDHRWLLATGSEDTDIRLFEYSSNPSDASKLRNITVLRRHTTGLQDLHFSPDGNILISAAGMEELYAWCLSPVPVIGQGVVFACASPRSDDQSDARIMSIDMRTVENCQEDHVPSYLIAAASSNGRLKILQLNSAADPAEMHFTLLHTLDFGTICLTQALFCPESTTKTQSNASFLVGATNGSVRTCTFPSFNTILTTTTTSFPETKDCTVLPFHHKLHQNSIAALQALQLDSKHQLLATGGDDSALVLTLITDTAPPSPSLIEPSPAPPIQEARYLYRSLLIPSAHAAALTALHLFAVTPRSSSSSLNENQKHFRVMTAGNDQKIQAWSITVDMTMLKARLEPDGVGDRDSMDEVQVDWLGEWYTDVADISVMEVLSGMEGDGAMDVFDVLVVGVGMELLRLDLRGWRSQN